MATPDPRPLPLVGPLAKCPACRARQTGAEPPDQPCRRCGADLSSLRTAYHQARRRQERARWALAQGQAAEALRQAQQAVRLVDAPETRRTLVAALVAAGPHTPGPGVNGSPPAG